MVMANCNVKPTHIYIFFACFSVNKKFVVLVLKLKCSGKTMRMPMQACRQPPPRRNFDKSFVKCVRTKDFVGAAPVFHMKKSRSCLRLVSVAVFSANRTSVEQERFLFLVIFRSRNTERFNSYLKIKVKHALFFFIVFSR